MPRSPYLTFRPLRASLSLIAAVILVATFAVVAKTVVESTTDLTYTIHWFETVPFLVLLVAIVLNGWANERARQGAEES